ncbi:hypothetical protein [Bosea sp. (in: a-proteobacteria)]
MSLCSSSSTTLRVGGRAKGGGEVRDNTINIEICDLSNGYLHDNKITYD